MIKCPNCGEEIEVGSKFCGECGTAILQGKECPQCHTKLALRAKFCKECGYSFASKREGGASVGDKNVIAGDVVGKKDIYHVSGNTTVVKNVDESKKLVQCSICGKNMAIPDSIRCKSCGETVCEDCFDDEVKSCKKCVDVHNEAVANEYREAVIDVVKSGKIGLMDRKRLIALQQKIGINVSVAMQIESQLKPSAVACIPTADVKAFDKANREKAFELFYRKGDYKKTAEILAPFFTEETKDEELVAMYIGALSKFNPPAAQQAITSLKADVVSAYVASFDMSMKSDDFANAEKIIDAAEGFWPDNYLVKCRRIVFLCEMEKISGNRDLCGKITDARKKLPQASTLIEKSWEAYIDLKLVHQENEETVVEAKCRDKGLLLDIVSQGLDKQGARYCIVDISCGENAKKYPVYYMDTESIFDWPDVFKSQLIAFRKIDAGVYTIGHGCSDVYDFDKIETEAPANPNPRHDVILTSPYYIAVFPITVRQWELMTGKQEEDPEDVRHPFSAARCLSYSRLRGSKIGLRWPVEDALDTDSFLYMFRKKSGIPTVDLPTDAQWEVACRAGVDADFYSGQNIVANDVKANKDVVSEIAVWGNREGGEVVGSRMPNNWGLYDFLGNVSEWCRDPNFISVMYSQDHYQIYTNTVVDPTGCLYPLGEYDEIEEVERCQRGGLIWADDPEKMTVWYQNGENACCERWGGLRPSFVICDAKMIEQMRLREVDDSAFSYEEKKRYQRLCRIGDLNARHLLARASEIEFGDSHQVRSEYEELAKIGYPQSLRALGRLFSCSKEGKEKESAHEYYTRAAMLGDKEASCWLKENLGLDEGMRQSVNELLCRYRDELEKGWGVKCFVGGDLEAQDERFRNLMSSALALSDEFMPRQVLGAIDWNDGADDFGNAKIDIFADDGFYVIQPNPHQQLSGYVAWFDFQRDAALEIVTSKSFRYLKFCKSINVFEVMENPDRDDDCHRSVTNKAIVNFYSELKTLIEDFYSQTDHRWLKDPSSFERSEKSVLGTARPKQRQKMCIEGSDNANEESKLCAELRNNKNPYGGSDENSEGNEVNAEANGRLLRTETEKRNRLAEEHRVEIAEEIRRRKYAVFGALVLMAVTYTTAWVVKGFWNSALMIFLFVCFSLWLMEITNDRGERSEVIRSWEFPIATLGAFALFAFFIAAQIKKIIH